MNFYIEFSPDKRVCKELKSLPEDVPSVSDKFYWIDIESRNITEQNEILKMLKVSDSSLNNYNSEKPAPYYEETDGYMNLDLLGFRIDESKVVPCKFKIILGNNFFITVHEEPLMVLDQLKKEYKRNFLIAGKTPGFLLFLIFDFYIDSIIQVIYHYDQDMQEVEERISDGKFTENVLQDIFNMRRNIQLVKRVVEPTSNILMLLSTRKTTFISDECRSFLKNLDDNMNRLRIDLDSFRELVIGTLEFHMSVATERMNEVMKVLTIIATIILPITFLAGIYGMNFKNMPELDWPYAYYAVLGSMGIIAISLYCIFKFRKWL